MRGAVSEELSDSWQGRSEGSFGHLGLKIKERPKRASEILKLLE